MHYYTSLAIAGQSHHKIYKYKYNNNNDETNDGNDYDDTNSNI